MGAGCSAGAAFDPNVLSLAHYEIHRVVGKGGFGKVNAIIRKRTNPPAWFALKTLSKTVILEKNCVKMIWNERNLLSIVDSPHVVLMHHAFQDDSNCYVVMDLLLGGDLKFHLGSKYKGGFKEEHVRFYIAGILCGLHDLHSKGILHRDIKPENVILDNDGYPRITDLGVSVKTDNLRYKGNSGTLSYMAPELFVGNNEHGVAADMFSLGIMAYELFFAKRPWNGGIRPRIEANPDFVKELPEIRYSEYYPSDILDGSAASTLSKPGRAFLRALLHPVERERLGFEGGTDAVMKHEWYNGFNWEKFNAKTLAAPFKPTIDEKNANCDTAAHDFDDVLEQSSRPSVFIKGDQQQAFHGFEYNVDLTANKTP